MGLILSIDPAIRTPEDFGCTLIEETKGKVSRVSFLTPAELGIAFPLDPVRCADAMTEFCQERGVSVVFIDGPQGWKDPGSPLKQRRAEAILAAPGRVGTKGNVKPRTFTRFVLFTTELFNELVNRGAVLVSNNMIAMQKGMLIVAESFPTAAWKKLGRKSLPSKGRATEADVEHRFQQLKEIYGFQSSGNPSHDELQALVSGLAGVAILAGRHDGYIAEGAPPMRINGYWVEGFIVNPREGLRSASLASANQSPDRPITRSPDAATLESMLYYLKLTREVEHRIERVLYRQGKIVGGVYVGRGQEAIAVGSAIQTGDGDIVFPSHRDLAAFLIRGFTLREILCNWLGRANGPTRGRDNTTHLGDMKRGLIPIISPLGDTCPVACGTALIQKQRGEGRVTLVHFGEGTTSRGDVHESMNMAAVWKLPLIFICNNNAYAYSTPTEKQYAVKDLSVRGPAYGMPGVTIDGNDVLAVYDTARRAIERARAGDGPTFIECKTFRMTGHSAHDDAEYVPKELLAAAAKKDPVPRFEKLLLKGKIVTPKRLREMEAKIKAELADAVAFAESSPMPIGSEAVEGVYCGPGCYWKKSVVRGPLSVDPGEQTADGQLTTDD